MALALQPKYMHYAVLAEPAHRFSGSQISALKYHGKLG